MNDFITEETWIMKGFSSWREAFVYLRSYLIDQIGNEEEYNEWLEMNNYLEEEHPIEEFFDYVVEELDHDMEEYRKIGRREKTGLIWNAQQYTIVKE